MDLDVSKLAPFLLAEDDLNTRITHFSDGLAANEDNRFAHAAQSFHQVIENTGITEETLYKPVRHAVSHQRLDNQQTVNSLQGMGFNCTIGQPVDFTDAGNFEQLRNLTQQLKTVAHNYITSELARQNLS